MDARASTLMLALRRSCNNVLPDERTFDHSQVTVLPLCPSQCAEGLDHEDILMPTASF